MKTALLLSSTFSILLYALFSNLPFALSEKVVDINGDPIFPGSQYYIIPAMTGPAVGGGVKLTKTGNSNCPTTVLQDSSKTSNGLLVKFTIPGISPGIVFAGTPLLINFTQMPGCAASSEWSVFVDEKIQKTCVGIGGVKDHPGQNSYSGSFNIQRLGSGYKLVFCKTRITACSDIGRFTVNGEGGSRLILTNNQPFQIDFVNSNAIIRSMA